MSWWRRLLNLPPRGERWSQQPAGRRGVVTRAPDWETIEPEWRRQPGPPRRAPAAAGPERRPQPPARGTVMAPPVRSWQEPAGEPPPARTARQAPKPAASGEIPWQTEPESSFGMWGRRFLRGLVVVVLVLAAISGVRSWIRPGPAPTAPPSGEASYPRDEAQAVATRFATSYLTWDEDARDARAAAIGRDLAFGLDTATGWNGRGRQAATSALPGEVRVDSGGIAATVDVRVLVVPSSRRGQAWVQGSPAWQRVSVPVARTVTRVVVSGPPTYVADDPARLPDGMPKLGATDDELTELTQKDAEAFFRAYASSDAAVEAVAAPGALIRSLDGAVKLDRLRSWQVYAGNNDDRRATAALTWAGPADTTLAQTYTVTLRRIVAADGAERWQVAAIG